MKKKLLKLGIIGFSEGNGHPYSWSAIFNGYDKKLINHCGFPAIPNYLKKQLFPNDCIKSARVTHIWTQKRDLSEKIAKTCFIDNILENYLDMIGKVDGILLARDDAKNHYKFAKPFIERGLPIYIDKPFALSVNNAKELLNLRLYESQIFTCSALRYAKELKPSKLEIDKIGRIESIEASIPKDWNRYAIHIIEPTLNLIPTRGRILSFERNNSKKSTSLNLSYENIDKICFTTLGLSSKPLCIKIFGTNDRLLLSFEDTFTAFRSALNTFVESIIDKQIRIDIETLLEITRIIELGKD